VVRPQRGGKRECLDGCAGPAAAAPRCLNKRCVAFDYRGWLADSCTAKGITDTTERCRILSSAFDGVLKRATGRCTDHAGCAEYAAGIGHNCGGVTDAKAAAALARIEQRFRALSCSYSLACAARRRPRPRCQQGRCVGLRGP